MQRIAKMLKKVYSDECKRLKKDIFSLNFKEKKVIIFEKSKLHRQDAILSKFKREHAKFNRINCYDNDCVYISDKLEVG